jgi:hypothetical protein
MEVAYALRTWRESAKDTGAIPRPRPFITKAATLPFAKGLLGAPHIYLWGPALFSRHEVDRGNWIAFARALRDAVPDTFLGRLIAQFSPAQQKSLQELAQAEWPANNLALDVATGIDAALSHSSLLGLSTSLGVGEVIRRNCDALSDTVGDLVHNPATWGDGVSLSMLEAFHAAGIDRALLLLSDVYGRSPRPDLAAKARELGFLLGPYDSYHSVHNPAAPADDTWETAQFDQPAYETGRVLNSDGSGHQGFKNRGYHFSPLAARPYVHSRVNASLSQMPFSAWFVDCDATAECFDDYSPRHPATRVDDIKARRERLYWLESEKKLIVGSEEGSVLFADVILFGHGILTPYIGHLSADFKDSKSPHFLGRHWPSDTPAAFFKAVPLPGALLSPYFDPGVRIPLYQAAVGDEVIVTHHWSFDSFKFSDIAERRELMELLYMAPPVYHLNRETWPQRRERILRHFAYWSRLHRQVATAPLIRFEVLTPDRQLQRTTFRLTGGNVTLTVNFSASPLNGFPPQSATASGNITVPQPVYRVRN